MENACLLKRLSFRDKEERVVEGGTKDAEGGLVSHVSNIVVWTLDCFSCCSLLLIKKYRVL
jgi:hypothetical protein